MAGSSGRLEVEVVSIGDELLIGQTVNTNAAWMGRALEPIEENQKGF
jgi:molybdopterin-biosynthesis enzyme MoeA-like protein